MTQEKANKPKKLKKLHDPDDVQEKIDGLTEYNKLNPRYQRFVRNYIKTGNLSQAVQKTGTNSEQPRKVGFNIYQVPEVQKAIKEWSDLIASQFLMSETCIMAEIAKIAGHSIDDIYEQGENGEWSLKDINTLSPHAKASIKAVEMVSRTDRNGDKIQHLRVKTHDKLQALMQLAKITGLMRDEPDQVNFVFETVNYNNNQGQNGLKHDNHAGLPAPKQDSDDDDSGQQDS